MNNIFKKQYHCSVFSRQNIMLLLAIYNFVFLIFCILFTDDTRFALLVACSVSLVTLFALTISDLYRNTQSDEQEHKMLEVKVRKRIRDEYYRAHLINRKKELLLKTNLLKEQSGVEPSSFELTEIPENGQKVHMSYLNGFSSPNLPGVTDTESKGQH